jgi:hypothetical protein
LRKIRVFIGANAISGITRRVLNDEDCPRRRDNFRDRLSEVGVARNADVEGRALHDRTVEKAVHEWRTEQRDRYVERVTADSNRSIR